MSWRHHDPDYEYPVNLNNPQYGLARCPNGHLYDPFQCRVASSCPECEAERAMEGNTTPRGEDDER